MRGGTGGRPKGRHSRIGSGGAAAAAALPAQRSAMTGPPAMRCRCGRYSSLLQEKGAQRPTTVCGRERGRAGGSEGREVEELGSWASPLAVCPSTHGEAVERAHVRTASSEHSLRVVPWSHGAHIDASGTSVFTRLLTFARLFFCVLCLGFASSPMWSCPLPVCNTALHNCALESPSTLCPLS